MCESVDSPAENVFLNSVLYVVPRFQLDRPRVDRLDSATDLLFPGRFGIRVGIS